MLSFFSNLFLNRSIIYSLAKQDFKQRFAGNYLGVLWAFLSPLITIGIIWFVFEIGFKAGLVDNSVPFILWLMAGMIPWQFLADAISQGTSSIIDKPYLVKKIVFRVSTLPLIKILTALTIHLFFLFVILIMYLLVYKQTFHWTYLQLPYYVFCVIVFAIGFSWATASIVVFFRDLSQIIGMMIQFGFWLTPIFWSKNMVQEEYLLFLKLNPAYYIIEGFRDSLIYNVWFWDRPLLSLYFWSFTIVSTLFGAFIFKRLRPHFADVL
jgi:ABC-type polysaccharide/polyol phosphate export permease